MSGPQPKAPWAFAPTAAAKRLALAFASLFAGAALFVPALQGFARATSSLEGVGFGVAALLAALTAAFVLDLGMRPIGRLMLAATKLALDPRRPQARPISRGRLSAGYAGYGLAAAGLATLYARDAAQRADPTFNGLIAIGFGLLFGGGFLVMAVVSISIAAGNDAPELEDAQPRALGFGAALALGLCTTFAVDVLSGHGQTSTEQRP